MPCRVAFVTVFAGRNITELLILLSVNLPEPGIRNTINLGANLRRRKSPGNVNTEGVGRPTPSTGLAFEKFGPFFFPFLCVAFYRVTS